MTIRVRAVTDDADGLTISSSFTGGIPACPSRPFRRS
jgi:hypothetical protein